MVEHSIKCISLSLSLSLLLSSVIKHDNFTGRLFQLYQEVKNVNVQVRLCYKINATELKLYLLTTDVILIQEDLY